MKINFSKLYFGLLVVFITNILALEITIDNIVFNVDEDALKTVSDKTNLLLTKLLKEF